MVLAELGPVELELAEQRYRAWGRLDARALARAMVRAGECMFCGPDAPAKLCGLREAGVAGSFGPVAMCDRCAAAMSADPDVEVLRPCT